MIRAVLPDRTRSQMDNEPPCCLEWVAMNPRGQPAVALPGAEDWQKASPGHLLRKYRLRVPANATPDAFSTMVVATRGTATKIGIAGAGRGCPGAFSPM